MHFWPPVTLRPIEELSPGEAFLLVDLPSPAVGFCAQEAAGGAMADGALLVLLNSSADGLPEFVWPHALQASSVLSFGAAVRFHFDPTSPRIRLAASGGSCEGCLIVRRSGVVLRVPQRRGGMRLGSRDVDISSGKITAGGTGSGDVAITDWDLRLSPADPGGQTIVLFRFGATT
ncbi:hypothetical protein ACLF3G_22830 [Falsiroseomonas sp. HC035]|jgi:hypothetical protein|uniref:hypothetical protein n=1 Tax=Falsiroseomonas sp. HC035 TaxID=3390999 RepID=UPI003D3152AB